MDNMLPASCLDRYEAEHVPVVDVCKGRKSLLFCEIFFDIFSGCFTYHAAISSSEACLMRLTLLNVFSRAVFLFFAYSLDIVQSGRHLTLASFVPVEGDGEAVYLVLYVFQQMEQGSALLHTDGQRRESV